MSNDVYESPKSEVLTDSDETVSLTLKQILFSFRGRIRRATYWGAMAGMFGVMFVLIIAMGMLGLSENALLAVMAIIYIPIIWISLAVQVKRWHDRDKSGWFVLVSFIPIIGPIWAFIENGCLAGSSSTNRFGPPQA